MQEGRDEGHHENTSWEHKSIIIGALGYFILAIDLIPDFIPVAGFADDIAALTACIKTVMDNITPDIKRKAVQKLTDWFGEVVYSKNVSPYAPNAVPY